MTSNGIVSGEVDLSRIKGLLFDIDGTISDTDDHMVDRFTRFLNPFAWLFQNRDPKRFARWVVMAVETPANFLYNLSDRMGVDRFFSKILTRRTGDSEPGRNRYWLIPGSREMLTALKAHFPLAVVSARDAKTTAEFLKYFNLEEFFDIVVTAQSCEHTKPFPDPIQFAARELGLEPEQCLMIGDTVVDIAAGKAAGTLTAAVLCGFGTQRELSRAGADLVLDSTTDLQSILLPE